MGRIDCQLFWATSRSIGAEDVLSVVPPANAEPTKGHADAPDDGDEGDDRGNPLADDGRNERHEVEKVKHEGDDAENDENVGHVARLLQIGVACAYSLFSAVFHHLFETTLYDPPHS